MTDLAVDVFLRLVIERMRGPQEGSAPHLSSLRPRAQRRNHILVLVVRKLDSELLGPGRIAKAQARIVARRSLRMADSADDGLSAFEELRAMAAHAGVVIGKVGNIGKISDLLPVRGRCFVASLAVLLVLFGCV